MNSADQYPEFYRPFLWGSLTLSILAGFGLAAHLSSVMALGLVRGDVTIGLIRAHGHVQLLGWIGMLIIGISLYVFPRLQSKAFSNNNLIPVIFKLLLAGVVIFATAKILVPYFTGSTRFVITLVGTAGTFLETLAILLYLYLALGTFTGKPFDRSETKRLLPYFAPVFCGWLVFAVGNAAISFSAFNPVFPHSDPEWHNFLLEIFQRLIITPAIMGFGLKMLPNFLGLRAPLWPVKAVGLTYASGALIYFAAYAANIISAGNIHLIILINAAGLAFMSLGLIWYIWELDALFFRVKPERVSLKIYRSDASSLRGRFGDRGEFGRFELFIIAGFGWALIGAALELLNSVLMISGYPKYIEPVNIRHIFLAGFAAHIVFGVGTRLLPNLIKQSLYSPKLTLMSFVLLFSGTLFRILPGLTAKFGIVLPSWLFGISGTLALSALIIFTVNIVRTPYNN
ncbi:MAG: hypothetical protein D6719_11485 [Candidatus Dadabacteria bacterium]|nr:MAG: hypothetical protein D6719_11485 [Candidatus Dadabacteria bacterium]